MISATYNALSLIVKAFLTLREMSNFVEFTGLWYSTTLDES